MKGNTDRLDREAEVREQERKRLEREAIAEISGEPHEREPSQEERKEESE